MLPFVNCRYLLSMISVATYEKKRVVIVDLNLTGERQKDRQTEQTDRTDRERQRDGETETQRDTETEPERETHTDSRTDRRGRITGHRNNKESALKLHLNLHKSKFNQSFKFLALGKTSPNILTDLETIWINRLGASEPEGLNRVDPCALRTGYHVTLYSN